MTIDNLGLKSWAKLFNSMPIARFTRLIEEYEFVRKIALQAAYEKLLAPKHKIVLDKLVATHVKRKMKQ